MHKPESKQHLRNNKQKVKKKKNINLNQYNAIIELFDGHKICINTLYLAQHSNFFKCAFYGQRNEFIECQKRKIRLETISYERLLLALNLLKNLTKKKNPKSVNLLFKRIQLNTALDLLDVSAYLQIEILLKYLTNVICQKVTTSTLFLSFQKAERRYLPLAQRLWRIIVEDFKVLVKTENFLELSASQLILLLKDPKLNLDPSDELYVVTKWLELNNLKVNSESNEINQLKLAIINAPKFYTIDDNTLAQTLADFAPSVTFTGTLNTHQMNVTGISGIGFYDRPRIPQSILLSVGGWATGGPTNQIEFYEPNRHRWLAVLEQSRLSCLQRRAYHALINNSFEKNSTNHNIYLIGGYDGVSHHKSVYKFDLDNMIWSEIAPMNEQRCYVSGTMLNDENIIAIGGFNEDSRLRSAEILNIECNQWSNIATMNTIRSDADCVNINGRIYVIGGFNGSACHDTCEYYDATMNTWIQLCKKMRFKRSGVRAVCFTNNVIFVVGGFTGTIRLRTPEFFDTREGVWHTLSDMIDKRSNFGINILDSQVIVCGGYCNVRTTNLCESFDWRANVWSVMPEMSFSRSALTVCRIDRHPIIKHIVEEYDYCERLPLFA